MWEMLGAMVLRPFAELFSEMVEFDGGKKWYVMGKVLHPINWYPNWEPVYD